MKIPSYSAKILAKKLKVTRGEKSLREFARELNISHTQLARLESADANATLITLDKRYRHLKIEPFELFEPLEMYRKRKLEEPIARSRRQAQRIKT